MENSMPKVRDTYLVRVVDDGGKTTTAAVVAENDGRAWAIKLADAMRRGGLDAEAFEPIVEPEASSDWTTTYPEKHRDVLRRHGMRPQDHSAACEYNARLIERAEAGLTGKELADAADALFDEHILERERDEDDYDGYIDWKALMYEAQSERVGVTIVPRKGADHDE
jgi:hypothetical protein